MVLFLFIFVFLINLSLFTTTINGCMATPPNISEPEIPVEPGELACATCPALPLQVAPDNPGIENGMGAVTETILASGCKSYTVTCQATAGNPPVGIGGLQGGQPVVLAGPTPGPLTTTLTCTEDAEIEGTDTTGNPATLTSVYCLQAEVTALCSTCTLPLLPAPAGPNFENAMGTVTMDMVGGCTRFTVTCQATAGNPDIAFGGMRNGGNILVAGPAKGPITRQFICNNMGIVQGPNSMGAVVEFDSVYCSQTCNPCMG